MSTNSTHWMVLIMIIMFVFPSLCPAQDPIEDGDGDEGLALTAGVYNLTETVHVYEFLRVAPNVQINFQGNHLVVHEAAWVHINDPDETGVYEGSDDPDDRPYFHNINTFVIEYTDVVRIWNTDCWTTDSEGNGVEIIDCAQIQVSGCYINFDHDDAGYYALKVSDGGTWFTEEERSLITDCEIISDDRGMKVGDGDPQ